MADTILQILTWAIPSGGIGAAIAWVANRKVKQAESAKKIHDTYKEMYDDISQELLKTQKKVDESARENAKAIEELNRDNARAIEDLNKENARTRYALNRLSRAIEAIQLCPHRASCPVSGELQDDEDDTDGASSADGTSKRKPRQQHKPKPAGGEPEGGDGGRRALDGASVDHHAPARRKLAGDGQEPRATQV